MSNGNLNSGEVEYITKLFNKYDTKSDGNLHFPEVAKLLRDYKFNDSDSDIKSFFASYDRDDSSVLTLDEILNTLGKRPRNIIKEANIARVFNSMNTNKDDFVTSVEIKDVLKNKGINVSKKELTELMEGFDSNKDGKLSRDEFNMLWSDIFL